MNSNATSINDDNSEHDHDSIISDHWLVEIQESNTRGAQDEPEPDPTLSITRPIIPFRSRPVIPIHHNLNSNLLPLKRSLPTPTPVLPPIVPLHQPPLTQLKSTSVEAENINLEPETTPGGRPKRATASKLPAYQSSYSIAGDESSDSEKDLRSPPAPPSKKIKLELKPVKALPVTKKPLKEVKKEVKKVEKKPVKKLPTKVIWKTDSEEELESATSSESDIDEADKYWIVQSTNCQAAMLKKAGISPCYNCRHKLTPRMLLCVFKDVRSLRVQPNNKGVIVPDSEPKIFDSLIKDHIPVFPTEFYSTFTKAQAKVLKSNTASFLLPILKAELAMVSVPGAIKLNLDLKSRSICDGCLTTILCTSYLCQNCGRDFCPECKKIIDGGNKKTINRFIESCFPTIKHSDKKNQNFKPIYRFNPKEMKRIINAIETWMKENPEEVTVELDEAKLQEYYTATDEFTVRTPEPESRQFLKVPLEAIDPLAAGLPPNKALEALALSHFKKLWSRGEPMLVTIELSSLEMAWTPESFIQQYGTQPCLIFANVSSQTGTKSTVGDYFKDFGMKRDGKRSLKIKDWPPTQDFSDAFPDRFKDFMNVLPVKEVTRREGAFNLSAHYPVNSASTKPDLGPKVYISYASDDSVKGSGSTMLHMDSADAVNLMTWTGVTATGEPGYAAWDLFHADDSDTIRQFLYKIGTERQNAQSSAEGKTKQITIAAFQKKTEDPIHGNKFYLNEVLRARLLAEHGVKSWRIKQTPGQIVFIPAGCAHQVCNFADSIKIACDFLSIENLARCEKLTAEFRTQTNLDKLWREDLVQVKAQLLWTWLSAERFDGKAKAA